MSKEKPILFSGQMIRAILDGRKTQTRRLVAPQPDEKVIEIKRRGYERGLQTHMYPGSLAEFTQQPWKYNLDDRLWVRETFYAWGRWETQHNAKTQRDEWHFVDLTQESGKQYLYEAPDSVEIGRWRGGLLPTWWKRPAIFMPRHASRVCLQIKGVRVERLQEITDAQAEAEGVMQHESTNLNQSFTFRLSHKATFAGLWDSLHGSRAPWASNPWVWVIDFTRS